MNGQAARAFLTELRDRRAQLEQELTRIETLENGVNAFLRTIDMIAPPQVNGIPTRTVDPVEGQHDGDRQTVLLPEFKGEMSRKRTWLEIIRDVMIEAGHPLAVVEIRAAVREEGHGLEATDSSLYNSLYTALARNAEIFEKVGDTHWQLCKPPTENQD